MSDLKTIKHVFLLGIGGIGMSALARYFKSAGMEVCGYDKTPTPLTKELVSEGINVVYEDRVSVLPEFVSGRGVNPEALVIFTPAIPKDHQQYNHLLSCGYRLWKRSEVLGLLTKGSPTIAVAGTHGKTTTSTMVAHILRHTGVNCTAFLGGISKNYGTNLLLGNREISGEIIVVEADEFDRSFLTLHPDIAVITSLDADHLDIYGDHNSMVTSYRQFAGQVKPTGTLIYKSGLPLGDIPVKSMTYSIEGQADFMATNIRVENSNYVFDLTHNGKTIPQFILSWPGRHNVENALAASAACYLHGIPFEEIKSAMFAFSGVHRRFDYQVRNSEVVYIDDYAHHPEELKATILSAKELYPGRKILGIFQPHLYTRTRDFADGFGASLSLLDELLLLDIYPARELPIEGVTSEMILNRVTIPAKGIVSKADLVAQVLKSDANIVLTLGAGDIDTLVNPLKSALETKFQITAAG